MKREGRDKSCLFYKMYYSLGILHSRERHLRDFVHSKKYKIYIYIFFFLNSGFYYILKKMLVYSSNTTNTTFCFPIFPFVRTIYSYTKIKCSC